MCGISGFNSNNHFGNKKIISNFQNLLNHRGPDFTNYYEHKPLTIISNRLSILDLSEQGNQPMVSSTGRFVIVYNGEVYNYRELNSSYLKRHKFISKSDTETILELIENFGIVKSCNLLDGMFAFALLDKKNNKLFLVRDKNGQKPLYYYQSDNSFVFSSEIKLFNSFPNFNNEISQVGEELYLKFGYIKYPYSIYKNVYKLNPNNYLELDLNSNSYKLNKLYNIKNNYISSGNSIEKINQEFEITLQNAVKKHLVSDRPIGCFLSGGIDSSLVTFFAKKNISSKLHSFSVGFNNPDYDETESAKQIANYIGTDHHALILDDKKFFDIVKNISEYLDEPFADSSLIPTIFLSRESKKYVDVVLTGDGSDEFFFGYNRYKFLEKINKNLFKINFIIRKFLKKILMSINPNFIKFVFKILPLNLTKRDYENFSKFINLIDSKDKKDLFYKIIADNDFFILSNKENILDSKFENITEIANYDQRIYLVENGMTKIDRSSMYFSLETRSPFLSNKLTEFGNKIHPKIHTNNFKDLKIIPKILFKKLIGKYLVQKHKTGFSIPPDLFFDKKVKEVIISKCKKYKQKNGHKINDKLFNKFIKLYINNKIFNVNLWKIYIYQSWIENERN